MWGERSPGDTRSLGMTARGESSEVGEEELGRAVAGQGGGEAVERIICQETGENKAYNFLPTKQHQMMVETIDR